MLAAAARQPCLAGAHGQGNHSKERRQGNERIGGDGPAAVVCRAQEEYVRKW